MKSAGATVRSEKRASHPSRGAWIEIWIRRLKDSWKKSRTPRGVRGLKFLGKQAHVHAVMSHPSRGAWIEI